MIFQRIVPAAVASVVLCASCSQQEPARQPEATPATRTDAPAPTSVDYTAGALQFGDLRATGGVQNGAAAAYLTVANTGAANDTLLAASSPACGVTELHEMAENDGVMTMRRVDNLVVPAAGGIALKPGGTHIMLIRLRESLRKQVDTVDLTLTFAVAGDVALRVPVR